MTSKLQKNTISGGFSSEDCVSARKKFNVNAQLKAMAIKKNSVLTCPRKNCSLGILPLGEKKKLLNFIFSLVKLFN